LRNQSLLAAGIKKADCKPVICSLLLSHVPSPKGSRFFCMGSGSPKLLSPL
jgi:hypothetical protein